MQSTFDSTAGGGPLHVAIIMDGNGRWAQQRGWPRLAGHRAGADAVRRAVESAGELGIDMLTLYAFSSDNWKRPQPEVAGLMRLLHEYLRKDTAECVEKGVRIQVIGRRDRLPKWLVEAIQAAEDATAACTRLRLRIAVDYSARDTILRAAVRLHSSIKPTREAFSTMLSLVEHGWPEARDVDLLIRTGGERRLSDFLLWECAYAELYFTPMLWPDFGRANLAAALEDFRSRDRRYGALPRAAAG